MMTASPIIPVILCGGAGVRLWPLSRAAKPKQFLKIGADHSLIQQTLLRCSGPAFDAKAIIVSGESQRFLIAEDLRSIGREAEIMLEPLRRDSCAAVAAGCFAALKRSPDAMVLALAADHHISETEKFVSAVLQAQHDAMQGYLVTFGVQPQSAATGYGYIKPGEVMRVEGSRKIEKFVEKPNQETALRYVQEGYLWNSGNFLFLASAFLSELKQHAPGVFEAVKASVDHAKKDDDFVRLDPTDFAQSPQISVDYAVMEKTNRAVVYAVNYDWNDIGTWYSVREILPQDADFNAIEGRGIVIDGQNNLVHSTAQLTAVVGVDDLIVITTKDAVYVGRRDQSEKLKKLVAVLKERGLPESE